MYKIHPKEIYDLNQNSYTFGILDHDHKGLTGRGTKYWLTAVIDLVLKTFSVVIKYLKIHF